MSGTARFDFDPPSVCDRVRNWLDAARTKHRGRSVELFLRVSNRRRVARTAGTDSRSNLFEEGLAVRVASDRGDRVGFAATTILDDRSVAETVERASSTASAVSAAPIETSAREVEDDRGAFALPGLDDLDARHRERIDSLPGADTLLESILEVGRVEETIATTAGLVARRSRSRSWWLLDLAHPAGRRSRFEPGAPDGSLPDLASVAAWAGALAALRSGDGPAPGSPGLPWRLSPPAAGVLVRALVQSLPVLHEGEARIPAGPAWQVVDDPGSPDALFGGRFDDTGRPTGRTVLGDGRHACNPGEASGRAWRPSFRDPPEPRAVHPVVAGGPEGDHEPCIDLLDLKLTPVTARRWHLEALVRHPDGASSIVSTRADPTDLLRRFAATAGPGRATADGVWTPAVVLDLPDARP